MIRAGDQSTTDAIRSLAGELRRLGRYHSIQLPDGTVLPGIQTIEQLRFRIGQYPIPEDLTGKRVLDIGAWDGWFSFEMERRGATVVAVDVAPQEGFLEARKLLNSKVDYLVQDVLRLTPEVVGRFDIVLFFGVLYHTKHPLLALERVCELTTDLACIESLVIDDGRNVASQVPAMEFYEGTEMAGQFDNWVGPNSACLLAMCRTAGFARVELNGVWENRAHVTCHRQWLPVNGTGDAPELILIENPWTRSHDFSAGRDDYLTIWFRSREANLNCENVFVQVGAYACRPVNVCDVGAGKWQINCKLALGLNRGWHAVRVRAGNSPWSAPARVPVDLPLMLRKATDGAASDRLKIVRVIDGRTYEADIVHVGVAESSISVWVAGIPAGTSLAEISLRLTGADLPATFISEPSADDPRQVNAMVPIGTEPGRYVVSARVAEQESRPVPVTLVSGNAPR